MLVFYSLSLLLDGRNRMAVNTLSVEHWPDEIRDKGLDYVEAMPFDKNSSEKSYRDQAIQMEIPRFRGHLS